MKQILLFPLLLFPFCLLTGQGSFTRVTDPNNPAVTFTNTNAPYKGASWIDLDHDNWPDLFVNQRFLFRNDRHGSFVKLPDLNGATAGQIASGSSWGDLDNDGHPDVITASLASGVHRNNGDNTFSLLNTSLPEFTNYSAWDCALADADNNGRLDLAFVHACCTFHPNGPFPCRLYLQDSSGAFAKVSGYEFTNTNAPYTIPTWSDYDLDGDMDLFIGSGPASVAPQPDFNYKNLLMETGTFSLERLTNFPFMVPQDGQTYNFIDIENDGDLDICLTNYSQAPTRLYRKDPNAYVNLTTPFTVTASHLSNCWGDLDNDGDLDVLIAEDGVATVKWYRNEKGQFAAAKTAGTAGNQVCGIALADYDNDGDLDFYTNGVTEGRALFRNDTLAGSRGWAQFTLEGVQSNRSAIGALLRLKATIKGQEVWQIREVTAHNSFQGQNDLRQHFGLNDADQVDSLVVRWPSGLVETFTGLAYNTFYKIVEGQSIGVITAAPEPGAAPAFEVSPNPVHQDFFVRSPEKITMVEMFDTSGRLIPLSKNPGDLRWQVSVTGQVPAGTYFLRVHFANGTTGLRQLVKF